MVPDATSDGAGAFRLVLAPEQATLPFAVARGYRAARVALGLRDLRGGAVVLVELAAAAPSPAVVNVEGDPGERRGRRLQRQRRVRATTRREQTTAVRRPAGAIGCAAIAERSGFASSDPAVVEGRRLALRLRPAAPSRARWSTSAARRAGRTRSRSSPSRPRAAGPRTGRRGRSRTCAARSGGTGCRPAPTCSRPRPRRPSAWRLGLDRRGRRHGHARANRAGTRRRRRGARLGREPRAARRRRRRDRGGQRALGGGAARRPTGPAGIASRARRPKPSRCTCRRRASEAPSCPACA